MTQLAIFQDHLHHGGAARAAGRWFRLLREKGWPILQLAGDVVPREGDRLTGKPPRGWTRLAELFLGPAGREKRVYRRLNSFLQDARPEKIWFHNIAGGAKWGWSEEMIQIAREHAPVLWTLHDMWALGDGNESYFEETNVRNQIKTSRLLNICTASGRYPITLMAPSKWLADLTKEMTEQKCWHLPNPMDFQVYSPRDQAAARRRFGLPEKGVVILAGADSLKDERKGFDLLLEAWGQGRKGATLALFGRNGQERAGIVNLGSIDTDEAMANAYRAADLYVHPARQENAPCTIQESLACGTPVLAFPVGGIPEMIQSGENGFLADEVTAKSLNECLQKALADVRGLREMREKCWRFAEEQWDQAKLMRQFEELVGDLRSGSR